MNSSSMGWGCFFAQSLAFLPKQVKETSLPSRSDLIIFSAFEVKFPSSLTDEQREQLSKIL